LLFPADFLVIFYGKIGRKSNQFFYKKNIYGGFFGFSGGFYPMEEKFRRENFSNR
jgi:hypothetical protein